ncbi:MAG TPA: helix-turn-helix domain-containing protein [Vicinamibacterales bacterium]|nr:helix-turn-helix domain-containing protein [Vicinamibacterales bacterium]
MRARLALTRPEQFRAIGDGTRWRILGRLAQAPATISELAGSLDMPRGTISHHVGVLEDAGLVKVVAERRYARVARYFGVKTDAKDVDAETQAAARLMPLRHALEEAAPLRAADGTTSFVVRGRMPAARARRFSKLLEELAVEFAEGAPDSGQTYGFVGAVYTTNWKQRSDTE